MAIKHVLAPTERRAFGQSRRKQVRRQEQKRWSGAVRQTDPVDALAVSAVGRVASLLAIRWQRMAASPFGFFRGAVPIMAADLAVLPHTGILCQLCGDAHVRNLGAFAAPDGRLVFDINDFDETIRGPFEWDVKRMAASLILAGREAGAKQNHCREAVDTFLASYRTMMHNFARMPVLELARYLVHRLRDVQPISQIMRVAERATPQHNLEALTIPIAAAPAAGSPPATSELPPRVGPSPRIFKTIEPDLTRLDSGLGRKVLDSL